MAVSIAERRHIFSFEEYVDVGQRSPTRIEHWEGAILDMSVPTDCRIAADGSLRSAPHAGSSRGTKPIAASDRLEAATATVQVRALCLARARARARGRVHVLVAAPAGGSTTSSSWPWDRTLGAGWEPSLGWTSRRCFHGQRHR